MTVLRTTRQGIAALLTLVLFLSACYVNKVRKLNVSQVTQQDQEHLTGVTTKSGDDVRFDAPGGKINQGIIEATVQSKPYRISLQEVQRLWVEGRSLSAPRTIGLTVAIAAASIVTIAAIMILTKQSCPFVYSWDGTHYVFDAEPYGGAITHGLERDDYSELEHLKQDKGFYRLLLTNEVDETQFTNLMELWVVDHARGSRVVSDETGVLRAYTQIQKPTAARDRYGNDLLLWLRETDRKIWEPDAVPGSDGSLRQEVNLTFAKPARASQATLIANAGTGLWGSYMIKKMVELHGRDSGDWLSALDKDPAGVKAIHAWGEREGTYRLPIEVEEEDGWHVRGALPNGGPLLVEDRAIPLDISHVRGSQLHIRMSPPVGYWASNSFGAVFDAGQPVAVQRIAANVAKTSNGKDIREDLAAVDDRYYPMPDNVDQAELTFPAPARQGGQDRTVFLHSRGWYQLHLRNNDAPDLVTFNKILTVPGAAAQFAADRFTEWHQSGSH